MANNFPPPPSKIVPFMRQCEEMENGARHRQYGACVLHAGYLRLHTHTQVVLYSLHFHHNNGHAKALKYYVERAQLVLLPFLGIKHTNQSMYEIVNVEITPQ